MITECYDYICVKAVHFAELHKIVNKAANYRSTIGKLKHLKAIFIQKHTIQVKQLYKDYNQDCAKNFFYKIKHVDIITILNEHQDTTLPSFHLAVSNSI